jgi:hypothetical protein
MLKRNGQPFHRSVSEQSISLTRQETEAYDAALDWLGKDFETLNEISKSSEALEKSIPELSRKVVQPTTAQQILIGESVWMVISKLPAPHGSETFFAQQLSDKKNQFSILERFPPESRMAKHLGEVAVQMKDSDPQRLLKNYAASLRESFQLMAKDLVALAQEHLCEKLSIPEAERVLNSLSAHFNLPQTQNRAERALGVRP